MRRQPKKAPLAILWVLLATAFLFAASARVCGAAGAEEADEDNTLLKRLLVAGCVVGLAVVVLLVVTQIRGSTKGKPQPRGLPARSKGGPAKAVAFRCRECGRVFREELTEACKIECPLCGHVWRWPPPLALKLLKDRMTAFSMDPKNPRGDLSFATKWLCRLSKGFAERILVAGKYLESGEMLCICGQCGEVHISQKKSRGLLGVCVGCKSVFLIW